MTLNEIKERTQKIVNVMNKNGNDYCYTASLNRWQKGDKDRTYINMVEKCSGTKHYVKKSYGYLDNKTGEYVEGDLNLFDEYGFDGRVKEELKITETESPKAAKTTEMETETKVNDKSETKVAIVNALKTAAVEDTKMYREKGMPEERITKIVDTLHKIEKIITETDDQTINGYFSKINPEEDVKEIGQKVLSEIKLNVPRNAAQKEMKEKIIAAMKAGR